MICDRHQIAVIPFPFVHQGVTKPRPALVLSGKAFNKSCGQTVLAMITTASRSRWPNDLALTDLAGTGLKRPCVVRFKLFTLPNDRIERVIGALSGAVIRRLNDELLAIFGRD
jgi:mRNA interferase MazF